MHETARICSACGSIFLGERILWRVWLSRYVESSIWRWRAWYEGCYASWRFKQNVWIGIIWSSSSFWGWFFVCGKIYWYDCSCFFVFIEYSEVLIYQECNYCIYPFHANVLFMYPLITPENLLPETFDVFRRYRNRTLAWKCYRYVNWFLVSLLIYKCVRSNNLWCRYYYSRQTACVKLSYFKFISRFPGQRGFISNKTDNFEAFRNILLAKLFVSIIHIFKDIFE